MVAEALRTEPNDICLPADFTPSAITVSNCGHVALVLDGRTFGHDL